MAKPDEQAKPDSASHAWVLKLMRREGDGVLRMLWRILGQEADVLDAYQDCFCKLAGRAGRRNDLRSAKAYLYRTAANVAIEIIRARNRQRDHWPRLARQRGMQLEAAADANAQVNGGVGPSADVEGAARGSTGSSPAVAGNGRDTASSAAAAGSAGDHESLTAYSVEDVQVLQAAIGELADNLRSVLVLREFGQRSYKEIAAILGITAATARVYRRHAVVSLAERMAAATATSANATVARTSASEDHRVEARSTARGGRTYPVSAHVPPDGKPHAAEEAETTSSSQAVQRSSTAPEENRP